MNSGAPASSSIANKEQTVFPKQAGSLSWCSEKEGPATGSGLGLTRGLQAASCTTSSGDGLGLPGPARRTFQFFPDISVLSYFREITFSLISQLSLDSIKSRIPQPGSEPSKPRPASLCCPPQSAASAHRTVQCLSIWLLCWS